MENIKYFLRKDGDCERAAVMWAWADKLQPEDIVYQIEQFKAAGVEEFYIHPCWMSEIDDYLSDFFMDMIKLAVETAERIGIKYSIYDDYNWASGLCAGKVIEGHPELSMTSMRWFRLDAQAGEPVEIWFKGEVLAVQTQYTDKQGFREDITDKVTIETFADGRGGRVLWNNDTTCTAIIWVFCKFYHEGIGAAGKWASFTKNTRGFTDTMNKEAVKRFLELGHETYKRVVGDRFGTLITRLFTDETSFASMFDDNSNTVPYSVVLEDEFEKEHGYKVRDHFIALTRHTESDEDVRVRYHYYKTCTRLFCTAYLDQVADWCHANGIELTGHMSGEGSFYWQGKQFGDFYEALSRFDIPGIDNILSKLYVNEDEWAWETKMLCSVAKFTGKNRTMCETFSGSGWDLSLEDGKRIMNKLMTLGVTYTIYMTASYSLNEGRKNFPIGYPPSHGFNNPLFRHYGEMTDYNAIRSSLMVQTKPRGTALILVPQIEAWTHDDARGKRGYVWTDCALALQKRSVDHDMFFEPLSKEVVVKDGKAIVRGYSYDTVVIPCIADSDQATWDWVEEFAKQGGRLVFVETLPKRAVDTYKKYDFAAICGISEEGKKLLNEDGGYAVHTEGNIMIVREGNRINFPKEQFRDDVSAFVRAGSKAEKIEGIEVPNNVYLARREAEGLYCCLVCNDTNENQTVKVRINSDEKLSVLDGMAVYDCAAEDGIVTLQVAPHEMPILMLTAEGVVIDAPKGERAETKGETKALAFDKDWHFSTVENNVLPLKIRYLTNVEKPTKTLSPEIAAMAETAEAKFACHEFPVSSGLTYGDSYAAYARFEMKDIPEYVEMFSEVDDDGEIWLNGHLISGFKRVFEWGIRDCVTDVTKYVKKGTNTLVLIDTMPDWKAPHQMPWIVIRGNFRLDEGDAITVADDIVKPDIFTTQGWRYFGGNAIYKGSFSLGENDKGRVKIGLETNEVVEVIVNGTSAGTLYWKPYELDITDFCKVGKNTVELKFTTSYDATMKLEEVVLVCQGVMEYRDEAPIKKIGLLAEPTITVTAE